MEKQISGNSDALCLAMRIIVCMSIGIDNHCDLETLLDLQEQDGGWDAGRLWRFPRLGKWVASRGLSTAFAIKAIELLKTA